MPSFLLSIKPTVITNNEIMSNKSISESKMMTYILISIFLFLSALGFIIFFYRIKAFFLQKCKKNNIVDIENNIISSNKVHPIYNEIDIERNDTDSERSFKCEIRKVSDVSE